MNKYLLPVLAAFTVVMVALAIAGGVRAYSPVPYWDMWDGYLDFFLRVQGGDISAWWSQQAEHRIILSHVLFWLDLAYFHGSSLFLVIVNYLLLGAAAAMFYRMLRAIAQTLRATSAEVALGLCMTAWLFQWMQQENLTWAFQSQFLLAQLLPLCALYWLAKSARVPAAGGQPFFVACAFGVAAVGSMGNGIATLPLMAGYAVFMRQRASRTAMLAALSLLTLWLYFSAYHRPDDHASVLATIMADPAAVLIYVLRYLGSPFYYLAGGGDPGKLLALLAGLTLIGATVERIVKNWRQRRDPFIVALLFFIGYLELTALAIAGGRLFLGADQVFASRYATPALMAWAAMLLLYARPLLAARRGAILPMSLLLVPLAAVMLLAQWQALAPQEDTVFQRRMASLALTHGIRDDEQVRNVYPQTSRAIALARQAAVARLSVFGAEPLAGSRRELGLPAAPVTLPACKGSVDEVTGIAGDARYLRLRGWLYGPGAETQDEWVRIVGTHQRIAGFALLGGVRQDLRAPFGDGATRAGFQGYVLRSEVSGPIELRGAQCKLSVVLTPPPFVVSGKTPAPEPRVMAADAVMPGSAWVGSDFEHSHWPGMVVRGSLIHGDADVGSMRLRLHRGARLFYRSGPGGGRQMLEVAAVKHRWVLPVAVNWVVLEFSGDQLPEGEFEVTFSDEGGDFGEWSAIALKNER